MRRAAHILDDLNEVRRLLMNPNQVSMRACERQLTDAVERMKASGFDPSDGKLAKPLLRNIRFLLEQARSFWQARQRPVVPALQYSPNGGLCAPGRSPTFDIEV